MNSYGILMRIIVIMLVTAAILLPNTLYAAGISDWPLIKLTKNDLSHIWGLKQDRFASTRQLTELDADLTVCTAELDVGLLLGNVPANNQPRLLFDKEEGLAQVYVSFDGDKYNQVAEHLAQLLGNPSPIVYDLMPTKPVLEKRTEWLVGKNTRLTIVYRTSRAYLELSKRGFYLTGQQDFTVLLNKALLKQVAIYEERGNMLAAAAIYQELLNGSQSYHDFTPLVQAKLAEYSRQKDVREYLGKHWGIDFSIMKNEFTATNGQQWVRMDLDSTALHALFSHRPQAVDPEDRLTDLSSVLCRVQPDTKTGREVVVEQIWLDSANQIIGSRPAWAPQDNGWPAPFFKQVCERFFEKWLTIGLPAKPINQVKP